MNKLRSCFLVFVALGFICGCAGPQRRVELLYFDLPKDSNLKSVKTFTVQDAYLTRFVLMGESIDNWTESVETFNPWKKDFPQSPEDAFNFMVQQRKQKCPDSISTVISKDNTSILYEIKTSNCPPNPDEHSINRILYGDTDVFVLIYTNKIKELQEFNRKEWIRILSEAKIGDKNSSYGLKYIIMGHDKLPK